MLPDIFVAIRSRDFKKTFCFRKSDSIVFKEIFSLYENRFTNFVLRRLWHQRQELAQFDSIMPTPEAQAERLI